MRLPLPPSTWPCLVLLLAFTIPCWSSGPPQKKGVEGEGEGQRSSQLKSHAVQHLELDSEKPRKQTPRRLKSQAGQHLAGRVDEIEAELAQAEVGGGGGTEGGGIGGVGVVGGVSGGVSGVGVSSVGGRGVTRPERATALIADTRRGTEAEDGGEETLESTQKSIRAAALIGGEAQGLLKQATQPRPSPLPPSWMPPPRHHLGWAANSAALPTIALDLFNTADRPQLHMRCHGRPCPAFSPCGAAFGNVDACWNNDLATDRKQPSRAPVNCPVVKGWGGRRGGSEGEEGGFRVNETCSHPEDFVLREAVAFQVFRVRHVFVSSLGFTFNRTHRFIRNGCHAYADFSFPPSTRVHKLDRAINWAHGAGLAFFHMLVEAAPQFFNLAPLLPSFQGARIPIISSPRQAKVWERVVQPLVGLSTEDVQLVVPADDHLLFVKTLIEPSRQYCGVPARALWHSLRRRHLLHPNGIPIFHNKTFLQRQLTPLTDLEMARLPRDWVVILVRRPGTERIMDKESVLEGRMRSAFGERFVVYGESLPMLQARALFRRARLVVAVHGAALSHTIFMPTNSSVLEVRPRDYHNTCLHHLAEACDVKYYLYLGEGNKHGTVKVDVKEIMGLVGAITKRWNDS